jgi:putative Holliday junction resolvase
MDGDATGAGGAGGAGGRTLGVDFGDRRIGLALSDPLGLAARPLMTLERTTWSRDLGAIREILARHEVRRIVVGLPLELDGTRGRRARLTETFMNRLRGATGLPVIPWDERLTTVQAERVLVAGDVGRARRREVIDQVAAVILLQSWLDTRPGAAG